MLTIFTAECGRFSGIYHSGIWLILESSQTSKRKKNSQIWNEKRRHEKRTNHGSTNRRSWMLEVQRENKFREEERYPRHPRCKRRLLNSNQNDIKILLRYICRDTSIRSRFISASAISIIDRSFTSIEEIVTSRCWFWISLKMESGIANVSNGLTNCTKQFSNWSEPCERYLYPYDRELVEKIVMVVVPLFFGMIGILGLAGNSLVVVVVAANSGMRTTTNILIINLAVADLLFVIFCIPFTATDFVLPYWPFGNVWCKIVQYLIIVTAYASVYTLVLMSLDRLVCQIIISRFALNFLLCYCTIYIQSTIYIYRIVCASRW